MTLRVLIPLLLAVGCGPDTGPVGPGSLDAVDYIPLDKDFLQYGPAADPSGGPFLMIEVGTSSWELRYGSSWTETTDQEQLGYTGDDGLALDGSVVLPAEIAQDAEQDGATVVAMGEAKVYYGTFDQCVQTFVSGGRVAGDWMFAPVVGPISLTLDGEEWELVYYE